MSANRDVGLIPEPILEEMGAEYGSKYAVLRAPENADLVQTLLATIEAGARGDRDLLLKALESAQPAVRYWGAVWLGESDQANTIDRLRLLLTDSSPAVRVAAGRALVRLGRPREALEVLGRELGNRNLIIGHYAIWALEELGAGSMPLLPEIKAARVSPYDPTRRIAERLSKTLTAARGPQPD
jgi:HEAT repeat protein